MSENKQDKKQDQYQATNPVIPQASMGFNASESEKMKTKKSGAVKSEGFNDVNDATISTAW